MTQQAINPQQIQSQQAWQIPTLTNSWVDYGAGYQTGAYMKDTLGFVHLKGLMKNGTIGSAIFTLPVGYRPLATALLPSLSTTVVGRCTIAGTGTVTIESGYGASNSFVSLDGITFKAEA